MKVLDIFSGIGGFSLGLERAGMRTVAFCEIDGYCRRILAKHWPDIPCYTDIRELTADRLRTDGITVDIICGGFPCQDISVAGSGEGIEGARSGLWKEYARLVGEIRPKYVIVENVSALLGRGLSRVLGDLAAIGYDAEWHCIPASAVGAPHQRDRIWIVAYPSSGGCNAGGDNRPKRQIQNDEKRNTPQSQSERNGRLYRIGEICEVVANSECEGSEKRDGERMGQSKKYEKSESLYCKGIRGFGCQGRTAWSVEPDVGRVANGIPNRVDRLRSLGNAVVPQIPEMIGRVIMELEKETR